MVWVNLFLFSWRCRLKMTFVMVRVQKNLIAVVVGSEVVVVVAVEVEIVVVVVVEEEGVVVEERG